MRTPPAAKPTPYKYSEYPRLMYPSNPALKRTQLANSEEHEAQLVEQGYQRTEPLPPEIRPEATKEEALALQREQHDAAWKSKCAEAEAANRNLAIQGEKLKIVTEERDLIQKRLAKVSMDLAALKKSLKEGKGESGKKDDGESDEPEAEPVAETV